MEKTKEEEIIGLNKIWARKNLSMDFFLETILPSMESNFSLGKNSDRLEEIKECDLLVTFLDFPFYSIFLAKLLKPKKIVGLYRTWCKSSIETLRKVSIADRIEFIAKEFNPADNFSEINNLGIPNPKELDRDVVVILDVSACSAVEFESVAFSIGSQQYRTSTSMSVKTEGELFMTNTKRISVISTISSPEMHSYLFDEDIKRWSKNLPFTAPIKSLGMETITVSRSPLLI